MGIVPSRRPGARCVEHFFPFLNIGQQERAEFAQQPGHPAGAIGRDALFQLFRMRGYIRGALQLAEYFSRRIGRTSNPKYADDV